MSETKSGPETPRERLGRKGSTPELPGSLPDLQMPPVGTNDKSGETASESKAEASPSPKKAIRVLHDFNIPVQGSVYSYKKGQIIDDPILVKFLLDSNCPVVPAEENKDYFYCKKCHAQNDLHS